MPSFRRPEFHKPLGGYLDPQDSYKASEIRNHLVAASGEFVGTFLFLLMAFLGHSTALRQATSRVTDGTNSNETIMYIALSYGFSFLVNAWILYRISGGLFNPAVTLGLVLGGALSVTRGLMFLPVQLLASISAAGVVSVLVSGDIREVQTTLSTDMNIAQGLFLEMFLTMTLVFAVLMLAAEKSKATFMAPVGIGLALFVAELAGLNYTGASLNPARSFGPCVAAADFPGYHWIYWAGPFLGAFLTGGYYHFVRYFNYWQANPGQDSDGGGWGPPRTQDSGHTDCTSKGRHQSMDGSSRRAEVMHDSQRWHAAESEENRFDASLRAETGQISREGGDLARTRTFDVGRGLDFGA